MFREDPLTEAATWAATGAATGCLLSLWSRKEDIVDVEKYISMRGVAEIAQAIPVSWCIPLISSVC